MTTKLKRNRDSAPHKDSAPGMMSRHGCQQAEHGFPIVRQHFGSFPANPAGLFDVFGNAEEWCSDVYDKTVILGTETINRVARGGSWFWEAMPVAKRVAYPSDSGRHFTGFRSVLERGKP